MYDHAAKDAAGLGAVRSFAAQRAEVLDFTGLQCVRELRRRGGANVAVAIFTADWDVEDEATDIRAMGAMLASKLCEAEDIGRLVSSLCALHSGFGPAETDPAKL